MFYVYYGYKVWTSGNLVPVRSSGTLYCTSIVRQVQALCLWAISAVIYDCDLDTWRDRNPNLAIDMQGRELDEKVNSFSRLRKKDGEIGESRGSRVQRHEWFMIVASSAMRKKDGEIGECPSKEGRYTMQARKSKDKGWMHAGYREDREHSSG